jgi:polyisoprenyl-phosphate glycosyltransferase
MHNSPHIFSIIIPVYCNEPSLRSLHAGLCEAASAHPSIEHEFVFVDDGSEDSSFARLEELAATDPRVRLVRLSRNFGSHNAYLAGLSVARGNCIAVIAADQQEPPDLPWRMLERWSPQTPVVLANRRTRDDDLSRVLFAELYYRLMRRLAFPNIPRGGFDCFLIDRRVADELLGLNEPNPSVTGLVLWTGFTFAHVEYDRLARTFGRSRWTFAKRFKLFIDSVVAFSYAPVRAMSVIGVSVGLIGFLYAGWIVLWKLTAGIEVSGWSSLMAVLLVLSGIQLIAIGVLGEYVWRTLDAARRRPNFFIAETRNIEGRAAVDTGGERTTRLPAVN